MKSWGSSKEAEMFRARQQQLIQKGSWRHAQLDEINWIRSTFGDKYDAAILEMLEYSDSIVPP